MRQATRFVWPLSTVSVPDFMKPCKAASLAKFIRKRSQAHTWKRQDTLMLPSPRPQNSQSPALMRHQQTSPSGTSSSTESSYLPDVARLTFHLHAANWTETENCFDVLVVLDWVINYNKACNKHPAFSMSCHAKRCKCSQLP